MQITAACDWLAPPNRVMQPVQKARFNLIGLFRPDDQTARHSLSTADTGGLRLTLHTDSVLVKLP